MSLDDEQELSPEEIKRLHRRVMQMSSRAQRDIATFFEFVIRHELTREPLKVAPHQRVIFSFVKAHRHVVLRLPVNMGKTFSVATIALWLIGNDVMQRGAIVSHSMAQARNAMRMVRAYIENPELSAALRSVFPYLRRTQDPAESWGQSAITVDRPSAGTRDPTIRAIGLAGRIAGARLSWLVCDDAIDDKNTQTPAEREKVEKQFVGNLLSRMDPVNSRVIVPNTPWHHEDLTYYLEREAHFATLTMNVDGYIRFSNARPEWIRYALDHDLRPSRTWVHDQFDWHRLRAHDPDPDEVIPLWPEQRSREAIEELRSTWLPHEFARLHMCEPFAEDMVRCHREWIEGCKRQGKGKRLEAYYDGPNPTFTGVDLAIGEKAENDKTAFVTFEVQADGRKRLLDVDAGRWKGPEIVDRVIAKADAYHSVIGVESNAAQQFILDFARDRRRDLHIRAHSTQRANKMSTEFGVEGLFAEFRAENWIIPSDGNGTCDPEVDALINECLYYQPQKHTGDRLMALWIGHSMVRRGRRSGLTGGVGRRRPIIGSGQF